MADVSKVGKRGTIVIPADLRRRFGIEEGSLVVAEAYAGGILIRPAVVVPTDEYRRQFFQELDREYEALQQDPEAWRAEQAEQRLWDNTLMDGLDPDEIWTEDGDVLPSPPMPDTGRE